MLPPRRQFEEDPTLQETSRALQGFAQSTAQEHLSETAKAHQRADLLALSSSMSTSATPSSSSAPSSESPKPVSSRTKRVLMLASAFAVTVLVLNVVLSTLPGRQTAPNDPMIARLLVPAAQSAQAFALEPVKASSGGMDLSQGWTLRTTVPASEAAIQQALQVTPAVTTQVTRIDDQSWRITPTQPLQQNAVYRVTLATALEQNGQETPYEYSWVSQTTGDFYVEALTPGPGVANVPKDTAIEWTFSRGGFANATSSIQFTPAVSGHYETRERTLVFLPDQPLKAGQVYRVSIAAGFGVPAESEMQLKAAVEYAFQVSGDESEQGSDAANLYLPVQTQTATNKPTQVVINPDSLRMASALIIEGYAVNAEEATTYLRTRSSQFGWFDWNRSQKQTISDLVRGKAPSFRLTGLTPKKAAETVDMGSQTILEIPPQAAGTYVVRISGPAIEEDFTLLQSSDLAVQLMADHDRAQVWVVNAQTRQPVSGATAQLRTATAQTDANGLASIVLPPGFSDAAPLAKKFEVVRLSQGAQQTFVELAPSMGYPFYSGNVFDASEGLRRTWAYLYLDRFVQRQDDTVSIFGLALDRATKQAPSNLKLRLTQNTYSYDIWRPITSPTLDEQEITPDAFGRFQASFSWKNRALGFYTIQLVREGKVVSSNAFEIRADAKPRLVLQVSTDQTSAYMGDVVTGKVTATFVDGTPFPSTDVQVQAQQTSGQVLDQTLRTNDQGVATFRITTNKAAPCRQNNQLNYFTGDCGSNGQLTISASSRSGEEGETYTQANVALYAGQLVFRGSGGASDGNAIFSTPNVVIDTPRQLHVTGSIRRLTAINTAVEQTEPAASQTASLDLYRSEQRSRQVSTRYDEQEKRTVPVMEFYTVLIPELQQTFLTNAQGEFDFQLPLQTTSTQYELVLHVTDSRGRTTDLEKYVYGNSFGNDAGPGLEGTMAPTFSLVRTDDPANPQQAPYGEAALGQRVSYRVNVNDQPLVPATYSRPLFVVGARGIKNTLLAPDANFQFTFDESLYPNATIYAMVFTDHGFEVLQGSINVKQDPYILAVDATTDRATYTPSSTAQVRLKVRGSTGEVVAGARVAISVADKALAQLYAFTDQEPVNSLYAFTDSGIEEMQSTHDATKLAPGGAEGGGGAGGDALFQPRKSFKDQAAFIVVETDANGEANASIDLPDNITTWRLQIIALSKDLRAGQAIIERSATKPVALDPVIPRIVYVGDQVQLKLRPIAVNLADTADVQYIVNAPELGINRQTIRGKGRENVYVPFTVTAAMIGTHTLQAGLLVDGYQDALEFPITVKETSYSKTIWESAAAVPGFRLPDTIASVSTVVLTSNERSTFLPEAQGYAWEGNSARLESRVAGFLVAPFITSLGTQAEASTVAIDWTSYQDASGLLRPLPQSSGDLTTSYAVVMSGVKGFDADALVKGLSMILQAKDTTRENRLMAAGALAALGKPALDTLQRATLATNLTWREQAILLRTFVVLGDRTHVQALFEAWMSNAQAQDGLLVVNVSSVERERFLATRVAAYAAGYLRNARFADLNAFVARTSLAQMPFDPIFASQVMLMRADQAPLTQTTVTYKLGNETHEVSLKDGAVTIPLNGASWSLFSLERVEGGQAVIQWSRRVPGIPAQTSGLAIQRSYRSLSGKGPIKEGDMVQVTLHPTLATQETFACYEIRDALPANLRPVIDWRITQDAWTPTRQDDGGLSFTACNSYQSDITYSAQVIAPGSYHAPATIMQNLEQPSLAALGKEDLFTATSR